MVTDSGSATSEGTRLRHTGGMVAFSSSIDVDVTAGVGAFASVNANLRGYRPVAVTKYAIELFNVVEGKTLPIRRRRRRLLMK